MPVPITFKRFISIPALSSFNVKGLAETGGTIIGVIVALGGAVDVVGNVVKLGTGVPNVIIAGVAVTSDIGDSTKGWQADNKNIRRSKQTILFISVSLLNGRLSELYLFNQK